MEQSSSSSERGHLTPAQRYQIGNEQQSTEPWYTWYPRAVDSLHKTRNKECAWPCICVQLRKTGQPWFVKIFPTKYIITNNSPNINPAKILHYTVRAVNLNSWSLDLNVSYATRILEAPFLKSCLHPCTLFKYFCCLAVSVLIFEFPLNSLSKVGSSQSAVTFFTSSYRVSL